MGAASHVSVHRLVLSTLLLLSLVPNPAAAFFHQCGSRGGVAAPDCGCDHEEDLVAAPSEAEPQVAASPCCEVRQSQERKIALRDQASDRRTDAPGSPSAPARCVPTFSPRANSSVGARGERDPPNQVVPLFKIYRSFLN